MSIETLIAYERSVELFNILTASDPNVGEPIDLIQSFVDIFFSNNGKYTSQALGFSCTKFIELLGIKEAFRSGTLTTDLMCTFKESLLRKFAEKPELRKELAELFAQFKTVSYQNSKPIVEGFFHSDVGKKYVLQTKLRSELVQKRGIPKCIVGPLQLVENIPNIEEIDLKATIGDTTPVNISDQADTSSDSDGDTTTDVVEQDNKERSSLDIFDD